MVQHSFCYSQIVVCCVDRLKPQSFSEILVSQGPGSAFQPTAEAKPVLISESRWAANGQKESFFNQSELHLRLPASNIVR